MSLRVLRQADNVVEFTVRSRATALDRLRQAILVLSLYILVCTLTSAYDPSAYDPSWERHGRVGYVALIVEAVRRAIPSGTEVWLSELEARDGRLWYLIIAVAVAGVYANYDVGGRGKVIVDPRKSQLTLHSRVGTRDAVCGLADEIRRRDALHPARQD